MVETPSRPDRGHPRVRVHPGPRYTQVYPLLLREVATRPYICTSGPGTEGAFIRRPHNLTAGNEVPGSGTCDWPAVSAERFLKTSERLTMMCRYVGDRRRPRRPRAFGTVFFTRSLVSQGSGLREPDVALLGSASGFARTPRWWQWPCTIAPSGSRRRALLPIFVLCCYLVKLRHVQSEEEEEDK